MSRRIDRETKSVLREAALPIFFEFFAGGGMVRAGLEPSWRCAFANDFDFKKSETYRQNWGLGELRTADVRTLTLDDVPAVTPNLVWASFPCQDLSLAGGGAGLRGDRSGTFWPFWNLVRALSAEERGPKLVVLENVCGTLSSHGGKDFAAICSALAQGAYRFGALVIDACLFVPQSRPRLFIVAVRRDVRLPPGLPSSISSDAWHTRALQSAFTKLPSTAKASWVWWNLPTPSKRN